MLIIMPAQDDRHAARSLGVPEGRGGSAPRAVGLTAYSRKWLTHTVYETKGLTPVLLGRANVIGLGLG